MVDFTRIVEKSLKGEPADEPKRRTRKDPPPNPDSPLHRIFGAKREKPEAPKASEFSDKLGNLFGVEPQDAPGKEESHGR